MVNLRSECGRLKLLYKHAKHGERPQAKLGA